MTNRPPHVQAVPDEIAQLGGDGVAAASGVLLALIRWRCEVPGPARFEDDDGCRWWRISQTNLAAEAGLSVDTARTALKKLQRHELIVAKHFEPFEDKRLAYRATSAAPAMTSHSGHSPQADQPRGPQPEGVRATTRDHAGHSPSALPMETLETQGDGARAGTGADSTLLTATANDRPPPRFCPEHPRGTRERCPACQHYREHRRAWDREHDARLRAQTRAQLAACGLCDDSGWVLDDDGTPAEPAQKCAHPGVQIAGGTDA